MQNGLRRDLTQNWTGAQSFPCFEHFNTALDLEKCEALHQLLDHASGHGKNQQVIAETKVHTLFLSNKLCKLSGHLTLLFCGCNLLNLHFALQQSNDKATKHFDSATLRRDFDAQHTSTFGMTRQDFDA